MRRDNSINKYKNIRPVKKEEGNKTSFQESIWRMEFKGCSVSFIALHHSPYPCTSPVIQRVFLDELTVFVAESIVKYNNIIIVRYINPHINDLDNPDVYMFLDIITAIALMHHINFPALRGRTLLDAIITESHRKIKILKRASTYLITVSFSQG